MDKPIDISKLNHALMLLNEQLILNGSPKFRMILKDMFIKLGWPNVSARI